MLINKDKVQYKDRTFCSENCIEKYNEAIRIEEDKEFFNQIQTT